MKRLVILGMVLTFSGTAVEPAWACSPHEYEQCGPFGVGCICLPKVGGAVGDAAEHAKREVFGQSGGPALERWIVESYNSAIGTAQPIPPQIRRALTGYIEEDLLNRVRFKVGDNGILNLAGLTMRFGDASAVTLINLVVFRNWNDALNDAALWAHELTHVKQYRDWGTNNFAISYARRFSDVEDPAYAVGYAYASWAARNRGNGNYGNYGDVLTYPRAVVCVTPQGTSAPFYGRPGESCLMQTPWGRFAGIAR